MKTLTALLLATLPLAACSAKITPPSVEFETGPVRVEVGDTQDESGSKFCPPGQAKKGRC